RRAAAAQRRTRQATRATRAGRANRPPPPDSSLRAPGREQGNTAPVFLQKSVQSPGLSSGMDWSSDGEGPLAAESSTVTRTLWSPAWSKPEPECWGIQFQGNGLPDRRLRWIETGSCDLESTVRTSIRR